MPDKVSFDIYKVWDDNNQKELRPSSIEVQLMNGGTPIGAPIILDNSNNWQYEFKDVMKYQDEKEIEYTVIENNVPSEYIVSYEKNKETGNIIITNTYKKGENSAPQNTETNVKTVIKSGDNTKSYLYLGIGLLSVIGVIMLRIHKNEL
ncbi:MAG: Cna B-type domain-containing protein [Coprobacillaceae bacterium]